MAFRTDGAAVTQRSIYASWTQRENESNTMRDLSPPATVHTLGPSRQFFYLAQTGGPFPGHPPPGGAVSAEGVASSRIFLRQSGLGPPGRGWLMSSIGTRPADVNSRLPEPITDWTHRPEASEARCLGTTACAVLPGRGLERTLLHMAGSASPAPKSARSDGNHYGVNVACGFRLRALY